LIKSVNGRNVYIIEPTKQDQAKTSTGASFANLYTNLRWQVWEQIQKDTAAQMQLQNLGYKAEIDMYEQASRDLRRSINGLKELKVKVASGGAGAKQIASTVKEQARMDLQVAKFNASQAQRAQGRTTTSTKAASTDAFGFETPASTYTRTTAPTTPSLIGRTVIGEIPEGEDSAVSGVDSLDAEIAKLEAELSGLSAPTYDGIKSPLQTSRKSFEQNVGVIGQGGGPFGLAARPSRVLPRFDEQEASGKLQDLISAAEQNAEAKYNSERSAAKQRYELIASGIEQPASADEVKQLEDILIRGPEEAKKAARAEVVSALQGEGAADVKSGDFLRRKRIVTPSQEPGVPVVTGIERNPTVEAGDLSFEDAPVPEPSGLLSDEERAAMAPVIEPKPEGILPVVEQRPVVAPMQRTGPSPLVAPPAMQGPSASPIEVPAELIEEARAYFKDADIGQPRFPKAAASRAEKGKAPISKNILLEFDSDESMVKEYLRQRAIDSAPVIESDKPLSTTQRKDKYKMKVVSEGTRLASQPKKFERIAKPNSDKKTDYVVIVDRLYEINKDRDDNFKSSYDEIARVYSEKPDIREAAHKYLVAKSILEEDVLEPMI